MAKIRRGQWCQGCGQPMRPPYPYRITIPQEPGPKGFVPIPGYRVYACSPECKAEAEASIREGYEAYWAMLIVKPRGGGDHAATR